MALKMCLKGAEYDRLRMRLWYQKAKTQRKITKKPRPKRRGKLQHLTYFKAKLVAHVLPFSSFNS